jgi:hypothetical protein
MPPPYWHDFAHAGYRLQGYAPHWEDVGGGRQEYVDEWGNTWARIDAHSKGEVARGAIQDIDQVYDLPLPDLANPLNFAMAREVFADEANDKFRIGGLPGFPFNVARKMRRLDQFLMDLLLEQEKIVHLLRRIEDLLAGAIVQYARAGADAVMFPEDWGTQKGLMIRPELWRKVFKPGFQRLCAVAHDAGIKVFMHSCGKTTVIIPDLIEAGIDVLQFDQPQLHGLDNLACYHGQITFWCPVDIQTTLQTEDAAAIEDDAREMIARLGGPEGGFIAGYYGGNEAIGLDPKWQDIACQAFVRYGDYRERARA